MDRSRRSNRSSMSGGDGTEGRWSDDIPDDLLSAICLRCCSSPYDRARFAAVCTSWRPKLPALPLLLPWTGNTRLDRKARAYSPQDGRVLRARLPWLPYRKRIVGYHHGGWIAATSDSSLSIMNLFTRVSLPLSARKMAITCRCPTASPIALQIIREISVKKIVFSEDPASDGCILAAMTTGCTIALCRLHCPGGRWTTRGCGTGIGMHKRLADIAFCNGELYGLSYDHHLCKLVIGLDKEDAPVVISLDFVSIRSLSSFDPQYIFELRGNLAIVVEVGLPVSRGSTAPMFRVFQLADSDTTQWSCKYTWVEVTSLDDHALFIRSGCCKAVPVSPRSVHGEVERNHVYYSKQWHRIHDDKDSKCLDLGSFNMYCYQSQGKEGIMSRGYHYREKHGRISGRHSCTWILPPHF